LVEALAGVRSGEITGALLCLQREESMGTRFVGIKNRFETLGYLQHAMYKLSEGT
jgi:hypothetical protein